MAMAMTTIWRKKRLGIFLQDTCACLLPSGMQDRGSLSLFFLLVMEGPSNPVPGASIAFSPQFAVQLGCWDSQCTVAGAGLWAAIVLCRRSQIQSIYPTLCQPEPGRASHTSHTWFDLVREMTLYKHAYQCRRVP
eukprot:scaffold1334_cov114-Skeletonema_dohrnii-CCMP3373.AAC.2